MDNTKVAAKVSQVIRQRILDAQAEWDAKTIEFSPQINALRTEIKSANRERVGELRKQIDELQKKAIAVAGHPRPRFHAADNISQFIETEEEMQAIQDEVAAGFQQVLNALVIDTENDHNTNETAKRVAKMYVREVFSGRYLPEPKITEFPNDQHLDEVIILGPFTVRSACSHHFVPIMGSLWIGIKPGDNVAGLSKYGRLAEWILSRPHIQEESCVLLANEIEKLINPQGLIVTIQAAHYCMKWRGIKDNAATTTSVVRGEFRKNASMKSEFFSQVKIMQADPGIK